MNGTVAHTAHCHALFMCVALCWLHVIPRCGGSASRRSKPRWQQPRHSAWQRSRYGFVLSWMVSPGVVAPWCWVEIVCWLVVCLFVCLSVSLLFVVVQVVAAAAAVSWHGVGVLPLLFSGYWLLFSVVPVLRVRAQAARASLVVLALLAIMYVCLLACGCCVRGVSSVWQRRRQSGSVWKMRR